MNNQKLLVKPEDLTSEDTTGYKGIFFTDASANEVELASAEQFKHSYQDLYGKIFRLESDQTGVGTTLQIVANKPKFKDLADLVAQGFVTRVDCFGAGEKLNHVGDVVKNLLSQGKKVVLFPFDKNKIRPNIFIIGA